MISRLLVLVTFAILARELSIENFGRFSFSWVAINTLIPLLIFGEILESFEIVIILHFIYL